MANFLRDQYVINISVDLNLLKQINTLFARRLKIINDAPQNTVTPNKTASISYIIRFDGKGYRIHSFEELLRYFEQANKIEHIIFTLETGESAHSNRQVGSCLELRLDNVNTNGSVLLVTSDDENWLDASFSATQDVLTKCKTKNGWMRTSWTSLITQIIGIVINFFVSLWIASNVSSKLSIQNSFIICFLFILLIFSNTWDYLSRKILSSIHNLFPNLKFYRPNRDNSHWLTQAIVGGIALAFALWVLNLMFLYISSVLNGFIK